MPKKMPKKGQPEVHEDLKGFEIYVNSLGELASTFELDKINSFLDKKVTDKKLSTDSIDSKENSE
jgi:hypothetical protein